MPFEIPPEIKNKNKKSVNSVAKKGIMRKHTFPYDMKISEIYKISLIFRHLKLILIYKYGKIISLKNSHPKRNGLSCGKNSISFAVAPVILRRGGLTEV